MKFKIVATGNVKINEDGEAEFNADSGHLMDTLNAGDECVLLDFAGKPIVTFPYEGRAYMAIRPAGVSPAANLF